MKRFKGFGVFLIASVLFGSCFDPPEFPVIPEIEFQKIEFVDSETDSLSLYLNFRDGDGDLGLDPDDPFYISYPYNEAFYFQENNGTVDTLYTTAVINSNTNRAIGNYLVINNPSKGKLATIRTRKKPGYSYLPAYNCIDYQYIAVETFYINKSAVSVLENKKVIVDSLKSAPGPNSFTLYAIRDTLLVHANPNYHNIEVKFFEKKPGDPNADAQGFVEFDWKKTFCEVSFDQRFPFLSDNPGALDGTLKYSMLSVGFVPIFSVKPLKLRIQIKDRALHRSNTIETPEFTLDKIKKK